MPLTTRYNRGDVVLVTFPFTDLTTSKQRPALVVSPDSLNMIRDDVVLLAITSQVPPQVATDELLLTVADTIGTGLLKPSVVKLSKVIAIHQGLIRRKIGVMSSAVLRRILFQMQSLYAP